MVANVEWKANISDPASALERLLVVLPTQVSCNAMMDDALSRLLPKVRDRVEIFCLVQGT